MGASAKEVTEENRGKVMDTPVSLGERRALAEDDCTKWTPRELLIWMLREMDSGNFSPDGIVVCFCKKENEGTRTGMRRSRTTVMEAVAMVEIAKHDLLRVSFE
jgi:hypothetical protein